MARCRELENNDYYHVRRLLSRHYDMDFGKAKIYPIKRGNFSYSYYLKASNDKVYVLKLVKPKESPNSASSVLDFIDYLYDKHLPVPYFYQDKFGQRQALLPEVALDNEIQQKLNGYSISLMRALPGLSVPGRFLWQQQKLSYFDFIEPIAKLLATYHQLQLASPFTGDIDKKRLERDKIIENFYQYGFFDSALSLEALIEELEDADSPLRVRDKETISLYQREIDKLKSEALTVIHQEFLNYLSDGFFLQMGKAIKHLNLAPKLFEHLPQGICHGDCVNSNFLYEEQNIVGMIDFEEIYPGALVWDLAQLLANCFPLNRLEGEATLFPREYLLRTLSAYQQVRPLTSEEIDSLAMMTLECLMAPLLRRLKSLNFLYRLPQALPEAKSTFHKRLRNINIRYTHLSYYTMLESLIHQQKNQQITRLLQTG